MVVIRCTKKLLQRVGPSAALAPESTTRLGEWYGTLFGVGHRRMALFISTASRLPVLLPARGLGDVAVLLRAAVAEVLGALGVPLVLVEAEIEAMNDVLVAPTRDRSMLGSLNDFVFGAKCRLDDEPGTELLAMAVWLSQTPVGPMGYEAPDNATRRLFGVPPVTRRAV
jgi:hypothetical protein